MLEIAARFFFNIVLFSCSVQKFLIGIFLIGLLTEKEEVLLRVHLSRNWHLVRVVQQPPDKPTFFSATREKDEIT